MSSNIFEVRPETWGYRGDPYLWDDLEQYFIEHNFNLLEDDFESEFKKGFRHFTGIGFDCANDIFIEKYNHGGMSSGMISITFWREKALPLLKQRIRDCADAILESKGPKIYKLIGPDGKQYLSSLPGTIGGYRPKKIYGRLDCPSALRHIAKGNYIKNRVFFADEEVAIAAGYRPCGICMKEAYQIWKTKSNEIRAIEACVGGYFGGYHNVRIDFDENIISWSHSLDPELNINMSFGSDAAEKMTKKLQEWNVVKWKRKYNNYDVCDGTQWEIKIHTSVRIIEKYGSNDFPENWGQFCTFIEEVTSKPFE